MRCRRSKRNVNENIKQGLAFFGSYGAEVEDAEEITVPFSSGFQSHKEFYLTTGTHYTFKYGFIFKLKIVPQTVTINFTKALEGRYHFLWSQSPFYSFKIFQTSSSITLKIFSASAMNRGNPYVTFYVGKVGSDEIDEAMKTLTITYKPYKTKAIKTEDGETFAKEQEGVACSLTQRLSLIKGELWYQVNEGLPLFDKYTSSTTLDSWILKTIQSHPDVVSITSFSSRVEKNSYHCDVVVMTKYGEIEITI